MKLKAGFYTILVIAVIALTVGTSYAQTFDCYITNEGIETIKSTLSDQDDGAIGLMIRKEAV